jgi:glycosyltransferase involved in cell wall biosynthesis
MAAVADTEGIVILSSRAALADFRQFFPMAKATPRVWSFHSLLKLSPLPENNALISQLNLPLKYLYVPNQFWAHKNHGIIFQALRILRDEFDLCVFLVCTGAQVDTRNSLYYEQLLSGLVMDGLRDQVRILGLLPRDQQLAILRSCAAVVQPSLFEGWSTVVEDVRAIGRPLFLSDIAVHREQMQDTAFFFNPHSAQALARLIAKYWPSLCSGPDEVMENAAQLASTDLVLASARAFSAICREAAQLVEYRANG